MSIEDSDDRDHREQKDLKNNLEIKIAGRATTSWALLLRRVPDEPRPLLPRPVPTVRAPVLPTCKITALDGPARWIASDKKRSDY